MLEGIGGLLAGYLLCRILGGGEDLISKFFHVSHPATGPAPSPSPGLTTTAVSFPTVTPSGLPAWPGGWKAAKTNAALVARAWALLPMMQMGEVKYEHGDRGW